jgi:hypothetical protein
MSYHHNVPLFGVLETSVPPDMCDDNGQVFQPHDSPLSIVGPRVAMDRYIHERNGPWSMLEDVHLQMDPMMHQQHLPPPAEMYPYDTQHRYSSPSHSGPSATDISSAWSDRQSTPHSSPGPSGAEFSPHGGYDELPPAMFGGGQVRKSIGHSSHPSCVSMPDVQYHADQFEPSLLDDDHHYYSYPNMAEEVIPMDINDDRHTIDQVDTNGTMSTHSPQEAPSSLSDNQAPSPQIDGSVVSPPSSPNTRRNRPGRDRRLSRPKSHRRRSSGVDISSNGAHFHCIFVKYGCTKAFASKNEWKR